jgi:hypothetical protein
MWADEPDHVRATSESRLALAEYLVISVRHPRAALFMAGAKTVAIRARTICARAPLLIRAAKNSDHRPEDSARIATLKLTKRADLSPGVFGASKFASGLKCRISETFAPSPPRT